MTTEYGHKVGVLGAKICDLVSAYILETKDLSGAATALGAVAGTVASMGVDPSEALAMINKIAAAYLKDHQRPPATPPAASPDA